MKAISGAKRIFIILLCIYSAIGVYAIAKRLKYNTIITSPVAEYDWKRKIYFLRKEGRIRPRITQGLNYIFADEIVYYEAIDKGVCTGNVKVVDKKNDVVVRGGRLTHYSKKKHSVVEQNPFIEIRKQKTTIKGDIIIRDIPRKIIIARSNVVITRVSRTNNEKTIIYCDEAIYKPKTGYMEATGNPRIVRTNSIYRADKIYANMKKGSNIRKVFLVGNARVKNKSKRESYIADSMILEEDIKAKTKHITMSGNAMVKNPSTTIYANRFEMFITNKSKVIHFYDNILIHNKQNKMYIKGGEGYYISTKKYLSIYKKPAIYLEKDNIYIESVLLERYGKRNLSIAKGDVRITKEDKIAFGYIGEFYEKKNMVYLRGNPYVIEDNDRFDARVIKFNTQTGKVEMIGNLKGRFYERKGQKKQAKEYGMMIKQRFELKMREIVTKDGKVIYRRSGAI